MDHKYKLYFANSIFFTRGKVSIFSCILEGREFIVQMVTSHVGGFIFGKRLGLSGNEEENNFRPF